MIASKEEDEVWQDTLKKLGRFGVKKEQVFKMSTTEVIQVSACFVNLNKTNVSLYKIYNVFFIFSRRHLEIYFFYSSKRTRFDISSKIWRWETICMKNLNPVFWEISPICHLRVKIMSISAV